MTSGKKTTRRVKDLGSRRLSGKQATAVKGGGNSTFLPAIQKTTIAMGDGSVRVATPPDPNFAIKR